MAKIIPFPNSKPREIAADLDTTGDLPVHMDLFVPARIALQIVKLLEQGRRRDQSN